MVQGRETRTHHMVESRVLYAISPNSCRIPKCYMGFCTPRRTIIDSKKKKKKLPHRALEEMAVHVPQRRGGDVHEQTVPLL